MCHNERALPTFLPIITQQTCLRAVTSARVLKGRIRRTNDHSWARACSPRRRRACMAPPAPLLRVLQVQCVYILPTSVHLGGVLGGRAGQLRQQLRHHSDPEARTALLVVRWCRHIHVELWSQTHVRGAWEASASLPVLKSTYPRMRIQPVLGDMVACESTRTSARTRRVAHAAAYR